jgi:histidinol dehydrogenase
VRVERVAPSGAALRALAPPDAAVSGDVAAIVAAVRERGDAALAEYVERFDATGGAPLRVGDDELQDALAALDPAVRAGLEVAIANVHAVAAAGAGSDVEVALPEGHTVLLREVPVARAAIYAPGGRHPYPSTVVMGVVTARAAGVDEVVVCAPGAHPVILAACALTGADAVFRMGGAHAVAALALGTETVARVDVIAGPGSPWVQEAKRQLVGEVGIDGLYGPSDVCVVAGAGADAELVALDLLAQAEHGPGTVVALVTDQPALADAVEPQLAAAQDTGAVAGIVLVEDLDAALAVAEDFAPEHLELAGAAAALAPRVRRAGCVFVGEQGATAFGDYVAGSNHSLPTGGAARFASGLSARAFRRRMSEVRLTPEAARALAGPGAAIGDAEGFVLHAESMRRRAS